MEHLLGFLFATLMGIATSPKRFLAVSGALGLFYLVLTGTWIFLESGLEPFVTLEFWLLIVMTAAGCALLIWAMRNYASEMPDSVRRPKDRTEARGAIERLRAITVLHPENRTIDGLGWSGVDLHGLDVSDVNLRMARLQAANLSAADLSYACLRSARLEKANLSNADLRRADLQYARLNGADLRDADLSKADLRAADLTGALLRDASFSGAQFDEFTTLPDGRKWTPGADLSVYGVASEHHRKPKLKRKRQPDTFYRSAIADDYESPDEPEPPAWVAREGRVLKVIAKRYPTRPTHLHSMNDD